MKPVLNFANCPRCKRPCPIGVHHSAHCTTCMQSFKTDPKGN